MQVGSVLSSGWDIYKRFWRHLLPIALVVYLGISLISLALTAVAGPLGAVVSVFVSIAGVFWLQAALVEAVADVRDGRADLSIGETLKRVWPRVPTVAIVGILAGIAIVVGLVLVLVPGLYLLTIWAVLTPAVVLEKRGVGEAFRRSRQLVSGYAWTVFGIVVVTFLLLLLAGIVIGIALSPLDNTLARYLSDVVSNTLLAPFVAATLTVMYFELRSLKEPAAEPGLTGAAFRE